MEKIYNAKFFKSSMKRDDKIDIISKIGAELYALKEEIRNDITGPVVASFGFIIALVWRDAIKSALDEYLIRTGLMGSAYFYQFISAIIVTIVVIIIMVVVIKFGRARKKRKVEKSIQKEFQEQELKKKYKKK